MSPALNKLYYLFLFIVFSLILAIGIKFNLYPLWQKTKPVYLNSKSLSQQYNEYSEDAKNIKNLQSQLLNTEQKYNLVTQHIPKESNFQGFLNTISENANQLGLIVNNTTIKNTVNKDFYKIILVDFSLSGSYEHFLNFLKYLQSQKYFVNTNHWTLTRETPPMTTVLKPENIPDNLNIVITLEFIVLQ